MSKKIIIICCVIVLLAVTAMFIFAPGAEKAEATTESTTTTTTEVATETTTEEPIATTKVTTTTQKVTTTTQKVTTRERVSYSWSGRVLNRTNGRINGPSGTETYYNLPMDAVIRNMRVNYGLTEEEYPYWIRSDGVKMLGDYIMVAANLQAHPRGSLVETSLGTGIVVDTGHLGANHIDIAVNW